MASLFPGMTLKFRQHGQLLRAEVTAQPLFSPKATQPREARRFYFSHTHVTLPQAQRASSGPRWERTGSCGPRGRRILAKVQRERAGEWATAGHGAGAGASGRRQQLERWREDQTQDRGCPQRVCAAKRPTCYLQVRKVQKSVKVTEGWPNSWQERKCQPK